MMHLYINIISISILQSIFFKSTTSHSVFSFLEKHYVNEYLPLSAYKKVEKIYNNYKHSKTNTVEDDPICNVTAIEKQTLCNLVCNMKHLKEKNYHINKIAHYKAKMPCEYNEIKFSHIDNDPLFLIKQKMYPCYGRHEIVRTSFIEDDHYDYVYLSAGHLINSIAVYLRILDSYFIIDYIYNVNILELQYIPTSIKEINNELKMTKKIFALFDDNKARAVYETELFKNEWNIIKKDPDPVCNLEYEKKITLCNIIFDVFKFDDLFVDVELNKIATYVSDLTCQTHWVSESLERPEAILRYEQTMYPCPIKHKSLPFSIKMLDSVYNNLFYLSSSPKRNSVYFYFRHELKSNENVFIVMDLIGNIDFKYLKNTIITTQEQIAESKSVYLKIQGIINSMEKSLENQLSLLLSCETDEQENEIIRQLFYKNDESQLRKNFEKLDTTYQDVEQQSSFSSIITVSPKRKIRFGPQVYKRLLQKIKLQNEAKEFFNKELSEPAKKILVKKSVKIIPEITDSIKVKEKVSKMISNMETIAIKIIQSNRDGNKQLKMKSKQKKLK